MDLPFFAFTSVTDRHASLLGIWQSFYRPLYQQQADQKIIAFVYSHLKIFAPENREKTRHRLSTSTGKVIRCLSDLRRSYFGQEGNRALIDADAAEHVTRAVCG